MPKIKERCRQMSRFEEFGVDLQNRARDAEEARKKYSTSCEICCNRGFRIDCDRCAIHYAHSLVMAYFAPAKVPEPNPI